MKYAPDRTRPYQSSSRRLRLPLMLRSHLRALLIHRPIPYPLIKQGCDGANSQHRFLNLDKHDCRRPYFLKEARRASCPTLRPSARLGALKITCSLLHTFFSLFVFIPLSSTKFRIVMATTLRPRCHGLVSSCLPLVQTPTPSHRVHRP